MEDGLAERVVADLAERVIFADRGGVIRVWNASATANFGYTADEAIGQSLDLIIPERLREPHWRGYDAAIERRLAEVAERQARAQKGTS
ncbi:PAS domain S-box-containing protein [Kineosphaera limosa]|uniref:PAS domain-containing protein n=1 Tax=Kineosphaera limosa NBRC 100340 TaxID=1184609 RepID=K6W761_9MICO|nr:PAS domain-containing protein [Kineosphaera limosa]NYE00504.1 PAS domain S-box-containing protein [Kineosphaera limosa]GAB95030.1 hypothetical protein KILIM_015_00920 [Kineosphaera limosa NBRC 100340]